MELRNLVKTLFILPQKHNQPTWTYVFDVFVLLASYAFFLVILVALITLIGFGYVPIEGGGYNNPIGTIAYLWSNGIIVASIPLAVVLLLFNMINAIKARDSRLWAAFAGYAVLLASLNFLLSYIDLVGMMSDWFWI